MIKLLSNHIINQIAAGEVIENPASVVKELVENSLDAGATHITIEIKAGGLQLIRVSDNGSGMSKEDALLSLERHATSKISTLEDLFTLKTKGFRGEALASIASIAEVHLLTSLGDKEGVSIEIEGGKIRRSMAGARKRGTTVEVRSLFYNVPARKKFQKNPYICAAEITKVITWLALAHPDVSFELIQQEKILLSALTSQKELLAERVRRVLGVPFFSAMKPFMFTEEGWEARGYLGVPSYTRPNRQGQYLFINQRAVSSLLVSSGVKEGYGTRIDTQRHPCFVLHLTLPTAWVDVNVHPQKKEVRFQEEGRMREWIQKAVSASFEEAFLPPLPQRMTSFSFPLVLKEEPALQERELFPLIKISGDRPCSPSLRILGLVAFYLFVDATSMGEKEGIFLVDLKAAEMRVIYEALHTTTEKVYRSQMLLIPLTLHFSSSEAQALEARIEEIEKWGFGIRSLGGTSFIIDAIPASISEKDVEEFILGFLEGGSQEGVLRITRARKTPFVLQEAARLFEKLLSCKDARYSPHGQPTWVHINLYEIERLFKTQGAPSSGRAKDPKS